MRHNVYGITGQYAISFDDGQQDTVMEAYAAF
jgi:hypothetical protein